MPAPRPNCPKCSKSMEKGFVVDLTYSGVFQSSWVQGEPTEKRRILGAERGIKWPKGKRAKIATYRCSGCGFLESYAT